MSTTIDQRVVEMRFDNSNFEKNVGTTMSTLDRLKQSLNLTGATKGLENVDAAAKKINMSGLTSAVETIHAKFSAMEVIAVTALANITNSAVNAGKRIASALTIDPIKTGFAEYETQINAVQTILANTSSKGTTINDVNKALDTLNTYADKTIYNFTEMTRNIGTFTAAGVDLNTSVSAIQGIANLAAVSGSTSQQASTAMYQLSQALASGTVKLQDWNSVVNAGMGGQVFQDALKRTAKVMGTDVDALIKKYGSFRESLSKGEWLTTDVLTETLNQFTMAAEEGTEQWEAYKKSLKEKGYTEEQAVEILKMANTATDAATKVKTFTQLWDTLKESVQSGWTQSWEIIVGDFEEAKKLLTEVSDTIGAMIGVSAEARNKMLQDWKDLGGRTALIDAVRNAFEGIIKIVTPIKEAFREVFPPTTGKQLFALTEGLKKLTENFKMFAEKIAPNLKTTFKGLFSVLALIRDGFVAIINAVKPLGGLLFNVLDGTISLTASFSKYVGGLADSIKESNTFSDILDTLSGVVKRLVERFKPFEAIGTVTKKVMEGIGDAVSNVIPVFAGLGDGVAKAFGTDGKTFDSNGILDLFNSGVFAGILVTVKKLVDGFSELTEPITGFKDNLIDMFDGVKDTLTAYQNQLKAGTLIKIASALAILAGSLLALSLIDPGRLAGALGGMSVLLGELVGAMYVLQMMADKKQIKAMKGLVKPMIGLAAAVLILSSAMTKIAKLDWNGLAKGLIGIAGAAAVLVVSAKELSKNEGKITKSALGLIAFATAMNVLAKAIKTLGGMDLVSLGKGLGGVGVLMLELAAFMKLTNMSKMSISTGTGILILSGAIVVLASAVKQFAGMDTNAMMQGLLGVGAVLGELALFTNLTGNASKVISTSVGLTVLAVALKIFASSVQDFGGMSWEELGRGLIGLAGGLVIMAGAMYAMNGTLAGSAAMLVMSGALALFVPQLMWLSTMSLSEIGTGLLALAGAFTVIGVAGLVLTPLVPTLIGLAGAIALLGVGALAVGGGLLAFSTGLSSLAVSGVAGAGALVTIVTTIIGLIPMMLTQLGNGVVAFAKVIADGAPAIGAAITSVILSVIKTITISIPAIVKSILELLTTLLKTLLDYIPTLMKTGAKLIIAILDGVAKNIGKVVAKGIEIVVNFINGIASMIGKVVQAGVNLIISFINGLADAIRNNGPRFVDAIWNLFNAIIDTAIYVLTSSISNVTQIGGKIINGLISGVSSMANGVKNAAKNIITGAVNTLKGYIASFKSIGSNIIQGLVNGITGGASSVINAAANIASNALRSAKNFLGIRSPSRAFAEVGMYADQGFAQGLEKYAKLAGNAAEGVGDNALTALTNSLADVNLDMVDGQPTIRPVLDMSAVTAGANTLNGLFANKQTVLLGANVDTSLLGKNLNAISNLTSNNQNGSSNRDIVQGINDLRTDIAEFVHAVTNMTVSLEDGTVVGGLISKIDKSLGDIANYKGRGN